MPPNYFLTSQGFMSEDELYHWFKKGEQAEKHKYIKREWTGIRWRYWYKNPIDITPEEYRSGKKVQFE